MKKKILFMLYSMHIGGVEKGFINLLSLIDRKDYDITLLLVKKEGEYLKEIPKWVNILEVQFNKYQQDEFFYGRRYAIKKYIYNRNWKGIRHLANQYIYYKLSGDYLKSINNYINPLEETYDLAIDYHGYYSFTTYFISEKVNALKKVTWIHAEIDRHSIMNYEAYYSKYNNIFCVSQVCKEQFVKCFPKYQSKVDIFYNILPQNIIQKLVNKGEGFNDNFNGIRILTVGRLSKDKGYDLAISTLYNLKKIYKNIRWYAIGSGKEFESLKKIIEEYGVKDDFILLGNIENPYPYINQCDIYVQTSRKEGYCIALAEARLLNKPIVTTNFISAYEQIINGITGSIVNMSSDDICAAIVYLIQNPHICEKYKMNLFNRNIKEKTEIYKLLDLANSTGGNEIYGEA